LDEPDLPDIGWTTKKWGGAIAVASDASDKDNKGEVLAGDSISSLGGGCW